ncbi:MAG: Hpt domain-containing protein [Gammaproteobacteria bacterium]|nr:Hpt domain-containing protein [Gammaproteobacteria bacterium]
MSKNTYSEAYENLRDEFLFILPEKIGQLETQILDINESGIYSELVGGTHSLKGAASTYGFNIITTICHQMEDVLSDLGENEAKINQDKIDLLLKYIDLMITAVTDIQSRKHNFDPILHHLEELRKLDHDSRLRILIIEPSSLYLQLLKQLLISLPIRITTVKDGYRALEFLLFQKFEILITGMETPPLNGDALISALRISHSRNQHICSVLLTTYRVDEITNSNNFDHILDRKSLNNDELLNLVKDIIEKSTNNNH